MAVPKEERSSKVADGRAVNRQVAQSAMPVPRLEAQATRLGGAAVFCTPDLIQSVLQTPLHSDASNQPTLIKADGSHTPTHVLQGALNAKVYFRSVMAEILEGIIWKWFLARVEDVLICAPDKKDLVVPVGAVLGRLLARVLRAA